MDSISQRAPSISSAEYSVEEVADSTDPAMNATARLSHCDLGTRSSEELSVADTPGIERMVVSAVAAMARLGLVNSCISDGPRRRLSQSTMPIVVPQLAISGREEGQDVLSQVGIGLADISARLLQL